MKYVYLLFGGNIGKVKDTFEKTDVLLQKDVGKILKFSPVYCSEPWGFKSDDLFYNRAVCLKTNLNPNNLLTSILKIESFLGRKRIGDIIESRTIDIDILLYGDSIIKEKDLEIPHPRMHLRRFTLIPLVDIAPDLIHPVYGKTISQLLTACKDENKVFLCS